MNNNLKFSSEENAKGHPFKAMFIPAGQHNPTMDMMMAPHKQKSRDLPMGGENLMKQRLKELRGWDHREHEPMFAPKPRPKEFVAPPQDMLASDIQPPKKVSIFAVPAPTSDADRITKLIQENMALRKENEYYKKQFKATKDDLDKAQEQISELENAIAEMKVQIESNPTSEDISSEEVKQEVPIDNVSELAKKLNCDSTNPDELKSLELALKLQAEEQQTMERELLIQQDEALREMNNQPGEQALNPDSMTYEQLLELEEKIGSVSKGLVVKQIEAIPSRMFVPVLGASTM